MTHLVIGIGEVGTAVWLNLSKAGYKVTTLDKGEFLTGQYDVLHVCYPPSEEFISQTIEYQRRYDAKLTIIYSSVPVGTTKKIPMAVHSPVEGVHPRLEYSVKSFKRWIGYNDPKLGKLAQQVWEGITDTLLIDNSDHTEFLKIASTSKYGINLVWAQYMADCAEALGMDYKLVKDWDTSYNTLYTKLHLRKFRKYVLDSPEGKIGGHCIIPNAKILDEQYPHDMLKMIKEMEP